MEDIMDNKPINDKNMSESEEIWVDPKILEKGKLEAKLYSDEPDPWGP
jgi:hypothetical protein